MSLNDRALKELAELLRAPNVPMTMDEYRLAADAVEELISLRASVRHEGYSWNYLMAPIF